MLTAAARRFAVDRCLAPAQAARLAILVEELVSNAREHGGVADEEQIDLTLADGAEGLVVILTDPGRSHDPRSHVAADWVPERGGGAGLDLVRQWTDILDYRRIAGRNELTFRLRTA